MLKKDLFRLACFFIMAFLSNSYSFADIKRPDLSFPVMPNSVFAGMDNASTVEPLKEAFLTEKSYTKTLNSTVSLDGVWKYKADFDHIGIEDKWYDSNFDDSLWAGMPVPSNYSREDFALTNCFDPVWFRTSFVLPANWSGQNVFLRFDSVDYFAQVWVNGNELPSLGQHEGYFSPFGFDIGKYLVSGSNIISVMVTNPYDYGQDQAIEAIYPGLVEKVWIKGIYNYHDLRPGDGLRGSEKQDIGTGGITGSVHLETFGDVRLLHQFITPDLSSDYLSADILVDLVLKNYTNEIQTVDLSIFIEGNTFTSEPIGKILTVALPPGISKIQSTLSINNPKLWWPHDHPELGRPELYNIVSDVVSGDVLLDRKQDSFGVREVEISESGPEAFWAKINGKRIYLRGTNSIPTEWMTEMSFTDLEKDVNYFKNANMNVQRVHAHVDSPFLYDISDKEGLMVLQDFPLQWDYSPCDFIRPNGDTALTNNIEVMQRMLAEMFYQLYNHPSIIMYTIHNEPLYVFTSEMLSDDFELPADGFFDACRKSSYSEDSPNTSTVDLSLNADMDYFYLYPVAKAVDSSKHVHIASGIGDEHLYDGWYELEYQNLYKWKPALATEYGAEAAPYRGEYFLKKHIGDNFWPPSTPEIQHRWRYHDAQVANFGIYLGRVHLAYPDYATWAFATQLYQSVVLKYGNEHLRALKFRPNAGAINFTMQNWWDSITWGYLDADRTPLMAYDWVKNSFSPTAVLVDNPKNIYTSNDDITLPITVVNDLYETFNDIKLSWVLKEETNSWYLRGDRMGILDNGLTGDPLTFAGLKIPDVLTVTRGSGVLKEVVLSGEKVIDINSDSVDIAEILSFTPPKVLKGERHYTLAMTLSKSDGTVIHENWHHFVVVDNIKSFYSRIEPGITPTPRFSLNIVFPQSDIGKSLTVTRKYVDELVMNSSIDRSSVVLDSLKPGIYVIKISSSSDVISKEVTLNQNETLDLSN